MLVKGVPDGQPDHWIHVHRLDQNLSWGPFYEHGLSNYIPYFLMDGITYPCWDKSEAPNDILSDFTASV